MKFIGTGQVTPAKGVRSNPIQELPQMDTVHELYDLLMAYLAPIQYLGHRSSMVVIHSHQPQVHKGIPPLDPFFIRIENYGITIYPEGRMKRGVFGERIQATYVAYGFSEEEIIVDANIGMVAQAVVRKMLDYELHRIADRLATDSLPADEQARL
jgi:hypothetical protein